MTGIACNVQQHLRDLFAVAFDFRQADIEVSVQRMRGAELVTQQLQYAVEQAMNIGADITRQLVWHQQAINQILQAVCLTDDDLSVLNQLRRGEFTLQQLRGTAQTTQRIFDLVRKVANQFAISLILFGDFCFAGDL